MTAKLKVQPGTRVAVRQETQMRGVENPIYYPHTVTEITLPSGIIVTDDGRRWSPWGDPMDMPATYRLVIINEEVEQAMEARALYKRAQSVNSFDLATLSLDQLRTLVALLEEYGLLSSIKGRIEG